MKASDAESDSVKILLLTKNNFIYKNKDSYILNITDLTSFKQVDQLKVQNNFLNLLTANVSHEMDSPLNCINVFAEKIILTSKNETHKSYASMMKNSASLIKFQVKTLLDRSLLENKMFTPNNGIHNIVNAIKQIIEMMSQISTKDVKIEFRNMIPGVQNIKTDIQRVQQVLINLVSNAAKFSKKGEEIFVVLREKSLLGKSNICIEVIDSGLGLSE